MDSHLRLYYRCGVALILAACMHANARQADAQQIDLSLNIFYSNVFDQNSGGTWQLAARSDETTSNGVASVVALLQGIDVSLPENTELIGPTGIVNENDSAGFRLNTALFQDTFHSVVLSQVPLGAGNPEQTVFYGVGSIDEPNGGVPNYTDQATEYPLATSIGPEYTTLRNLNNAVWGDGDPLGEAAWDHAALLVQGVFAPGESPTFYSDDDLNSEGMVFTSLPVGPDGLGARSEILEASTTIRTNYVEPDPGDFNLDGIINMADYGAWRNNLGAMVDPPGTGLDPDGSGVVDAGDYAIWQANFGTVNMPASSLGPSLSTAVPEPSSTVVTLVFSAFLLVVSRWQLARKKSLSLFFVKFP